jgi:hypothetical protein
MLVEKVVGVELYDEEVVYKYFAGVEDTALLVPTKNRTIIYCIVVPEKLPLRFTYFNVLTTDVVATRLVAV